MNLQEYIKNCLEILSNPSNWESLIKGAGISLVVATVALIIGIILGIGGASLKLSKNKFLKVIGNIYVEVIRGTPMLLQISIFYLVIPTIITLITQEAFRVNKLFMGTIAIGINHNSNLPMMAIVANNPPNAKEPVSPIKILAGFLLKYKKPTHEALAAIEIIAKSMLLFKNSYIGCTRF